MPAHVINVFVSTSWSQPGDHSDLLGWIFRKEWRVNGAKVVFADTSVTESESRRARTAADLQRTIYDGVARADIVVVPSDPDDGDSFRVQREIDGAWKYGRPVIAVRRMQRGECPVRIPTAAEKVVNFNPKSIIDGILEFRHVAFV